jgi:hypothetical protein
MRDTFLLLWVAFLIIGVAGSIVSSIRKQIQAAGPPRERPVPAQWQSPKPQQAARRVLIAAQAPRVVPQAAPPRAPVRPNAAVAPKAPVAPVPPPHTDFPTAHTGPKGAAARLFRHRSAIVQAVIAAEVLGKPRAFNDEYFGA